MFVGAAVGTNTATAPAHQAGDLIIALAFRSGSTTVPTTPAGQGWSDLASNGANSCALKVTHKYATGSSEGIGTFTNASRVTILVYRGMQVNTANDQVNAGNNSSPSIWAPGSIAAGSWVIRVVGHRTATTMSLLANHTERSITTGNPILVVQDTNGPETANGTKTWSANTSSGWRTWAAELIPTAPPVTVPGAPTSVSAEAGNGQATVGWSPPSDDGGGAITGYVMRYRQGAGEWRSWFPATPSWQPNFGAGDTQAFNDLGDGDAATVWDSKANSTFGAHSGKDAWNISLPANTRNGTKVRALFADLGMVPSHAIRLEYDVFIPSASDLALDFKLPGFASLPDGQSLWNASSGGSKTTDSASIRIHARPAGQWSVPHPFLEAYAYAHSGAGKTWTDWGLYWRLSESMNATGTYNGDEFQVPVGQWFRLAVEAEMNTPGQADGKLKVWLDGQQGIGISDLVWVQAAPYSWTQTMFEVFYNEGTHSATTLRLADMAMTSAQVADTVNQAVVEALANGQTYDFEVAAVNSAGVGAWSSTVSATPAAQGDTVRVWDGTAWVDTQVTVWDGTVWLPATVDVFEG